MPNHLTANYTTWHESDHNEGENSRQHTVGASECLGLAPRPHVRSLRK